jgi:hypothetical protein
MNSHDGAVCGSIDDGIGLLIGGYVVPNCGSADPGGIESGDEARVVPNHNEGTGEDGVEKLGKGSHSSIAMEGMLPLLAEKAPRSKSSAVNVAGIVVSRLRWGGGPCQWNDVGVLAMRFWSMDSIPCMGALTCLASCASSWCIRPSSASRCSLELH